MSFLKYRRSVRWLEYVLLWCAYSDYTGAVMCDGYRGYGQEQLPKATFGSCLIHIRRPFIELVKGVKGGFELSFYGGLKMHDLGGLRINRC